VGGDVDAAGDGMGLTLDAGADTDTGARRRMLLASRGAEQLPTKVQSHDDSVGDEDDGGDNDEVADDSEAGHGRIAAPRRGRHLLKGDPFQLEKQLKDERFNRKFRFPRLRLGFARVA
jgi:hypothetical protein